MPIFKTLEETYLNGDTLYNFGGYAPGNLFPTPVPYNPPFCIGNGFNYAGISATQTLGITENQDGGYFVCGAFNWYRNYRGLGVVKMTSNGDVDETFNSPLSAISATNQINVGAIDIKPSTFFPSKYYLCGGFNANGATIVRLNSDGSIDNTFNVVMPISATHGFVELSGGSLIMIGNFATIGGVSRFRIAKINSNGTLDTTFQVGAGFNNRVDDILLSPDEQYVYISGAFTQYSGVAKNRIVKLNATTGAIDPTFKASFDNVVREMTFDGNGRLWVCGAFSNDPGGGYNNIAYINCLDTISGYSVSAITQNFGAGFNPYNIYGIGYDAVNDRIICINQTASGNYLQHPTYFYYGRICAIHASTGLFDTTFGSSTDSMYGFEDQNVGTDQYDDILVDTNGNILLTGTFTTFSGNRYDKFIRLDQNGQSNTTTSC